MLSIKNTPNNLGVAISGDQQDFERLYEALHEVVSDEDYQPSARMRVLGVCYDLRHALMGNWDYTFVPNGLTPEIKKYQGIAAADKNVYLEIKVLWPEILFVLLALNTFVLTYAKKMTNEKFDFDVYRSPKLIWDQTYAEIRHFQAAIAACIRNTVSEHGYKRLLNTMNRWYSGIDGYFTQYIDFLNVKFTDMTAEKRLKNITIMAKRIAEPNDEYRKMAQEIREAARHHGCSTEEIRLRQDYPEQLDW